MNKRYEAALIDLDGTINDSKPGIIETFEKVFESYGMEVDDIDRFIGPPLKSTFKNIFEGDEQKASEATDLFRSIYENEGMYNYRVYDGIGSLIEKLHAGGIKVFLATSKLEEIAVKLIEREGLSGFFTDMAGSTIDDSRSEKVQIIEYLLEKHSLSKQSTVMIGDRRHDAIGASKAGIDCIMVGYGYAPKGEIDEMDPEHVANTVEELENILLG